MFAEVSRMPIFINTKMQLKIRIIMKNKIFICPEYFYKTEIESFKNSLKTLKHKKSLSNSNPKHYTFFTKLFNIFA